jgi:hypothetical protein
MNELDSALYLRLQGTAITSLLSGTTEIYKLQAKEKAVLPYIVWNIQGGGDTNDTQNRVKNLVVFIRAYAQGANGAAVAGTIDARIDTALHNVALTVSGWTDILLMRETELETVENEPSGNKVFMSGGMYRIILDKE